MLQVTYCVQYETAGAEAVCDGRNVVSRRPVFLGMTFVLEHFFLQHRCAVAILHRLATIATDVSVLALLHMTILMAPTPEKSSYVCTGSAALRRHGDSLSMEKMC